MSAFDVDVAVVGSGFGGGVAALRHAQAGRSVVVLEQGRRLTPDDLEAGGRRTRDFLWMPGVGLHGYFQQTLLRHVMVVHGVGVGGGSIVYAGVLLHPKPDAWEAPGWAATGLDWAGELAPHYDTAAAMLGREVNPQVGAQDRWLKSAAEQMGVPETFGATPQGISFADCVRCGACITGCPHGAKNSIDRTYLARAEELGARVRPRSKVVRLERLAGGGWRLDLVDPMRRGAPSGSLAGAGGGPWRRCARHHRAAARLARSLPDASVGVTDAGAARAHQLRGLHRRAATAGWAGRHRRRDHQQRLPSRRADPRHQQPVPALVRVHALVRGPARGRRHTRGAGASHDSGDPCATLPAPRPTCGPAAGTGGSRS